jgi:hypothetical protein
VLAFYLQHHKPILICAHGIPTLDLRLPQSVEGQHHVRLATHDLPPHNRAHRATTRLTEVTAWAAAILDRVIQSSFVCEGL